MFKPQVERARAVAGALLAAYQTEGIFGIREMPEDLAPAGVAPGSEEHLRFITLTVAIDYQRNADQLWDAARRTYTDPRTAYLFDPAQVARTGLNQLVDDMSRYRLAKKPTRDAQTWQTICSTLARHFDGQVRVLLEWARWDALRLLQLVRRGGYQPGFPYLKGPKISVLWIRMLHDNCGVELKNLDRVPIPVDIHTAHATLQTGCLEWEPGRGEMVPLREAVQAVWREALQGTGYYPLQLDEPLWLLSRNGCRRTEGWWCDFAGRCPVAQWCTPERRVGLTNAGTTGEEVRLWVDQTRPWPR